MTFGQSVSTCFRKYAVFSGRASRSEFWYFVLLMVLVMTALLVITVSTSQSAGPDEVPVGFIVMGLAYLALLLPYWSAVVRRLHDTDKSGWFIFVSLIPLAGGIILLVTLASQGTPGPNQYGADPEGRSAPYAPASARTVRCPFCAEPIQPQAIVCRYCGRDLAGRGAAGTPPPPA